MRACHMIFADQAMAFPQANLEPDGLRDKEELDIAKYYSNLGV